MITDIIGISGTRTIISEGYTIACYPPIHVRTFVRSLPLRTVLLVTGGAPGVDQVAEEEARKRGMATATIPYYSEFGKSGGFIRNVELVDFIHRLVAFWNLKSGGTKHRVHRLYIRSKRT